MARKSRLSSRTPYPADPPITLDAHCRAHPHHAEQALVRLELAGEMVPSIDWFIYAFVRKEAVLSSQIEGTQAPRSSTSSPTRLRRALDPSTHPNADVEEVSNYLNALTFTRAQLSRQGGPAALDAAAQ